MRRPFRCDAVGAERRKPDAHFRSSNRQTSEWGVVRQSLAIDAGLEEPRGDLRPLRHSDFQHRHLTADRYPDVFEVRKGSDPNDQSSIPTATYVVNGAGGATHTTISAALSAANVSNGANQIIGIACSCDRGDQVCTYFGHAGCGCGVAVKVPVSEGCAPLP